MLKNELEYEEIYFHEILKKRLKIYLEKKFYEQENIYILIIMIRIINI
jgi:hypothetical protein